MKKKLMFMPVLLATLFAACSKDDDKNDPEPDPEKVSKALLKHVVMTNGDNQVVDFTYNADSSFKTVTYTDVFGATLFSYVYSSGKRLEKIQGTSPVAEQKYTYDTKRRITEARITHANTPVQFIYDFKYDEKDRVKELKYSTEENAIKVLDYTSGYTYDATGSLTSITTVPQSGQIRTLTMENYSEAFNLNSWAFISPYGGGRFPEFYNYVIFSSMKKLPGKITETTNGQVVSATENRFTIQEGRINKIAVDFKMPNFPQNNEAYDITFKY
ncbi:MAG: hypothetical protein QM731_27490 [Chitinophagaceae bacterium]